MKTPSVTAAQSLALGILIGIASALLSAMLLGSLLAGGNWTFPMDAASAAVFTA